jgi:hypothetical protein
MTSKSASAAALIFALGLFCGAAAPLPAVADGIEPGLWQITETIIMNGNRTPSQMRTRCLSAEQAGDTAATFSPEYRTVNSDCERAEFSSTASRLKWRMLCKGQLDMDVSGDFSFDTPKHYSAKIESKGSVAGRTMVETSVTIDGEHMGECK